MWEDTTIAALGKGLEGTRQQLETIANNLANAETPGYRAVHVSFEESLQRALRAAPGRQQEAIARVRPEGMAQVGNSLRHDGNTVDLEAEVVTLGEAGLRYRVLARLLHKKLQMLHEVIGGGGR